MTSQCKYDELLAVYRGLDPAARKSVDAHLHQCPTCAARLARYEQVDQSLLTLPEFGLPVRLHQPWFGQLPADYATTSDPRLRTGLSPVFGRVLLPVGLVISLIVGIWLLLASLTGGDGHIAATPTLTFTPTATTAALLHKNDSVARRTGFTVPPPPRAMAVFPSPRPTSTAAQLRPVAVLRFP